MINKIKQIFCSLPARGQARFLARLLHECTMWARSQYPEILSEPAGAVDELKRFNELSHVVSAQLRAILEGNGARYPDDVFFDILIEQACTTKGAAEVGRLLKELLGGHSFAPANGLDNRAPDASST